MYTTIVGSNFRPIDAQLAITSLKQGDHVELVRDPENPYDENAIQAIATVSGERHHVGFIPREEAMHLAPRMDAGVKLQCVIINPGKKPIVEVTVETAPETAA